MSSNDFTPDAFDLGTYHRPVTTHSPAAQYWFDRGLTWTHAFNHHEAALSFERAISHDPTCVMAHWGLAYTLGPHYNKPWHTFSAPELSSVLSRAQSAIQSALPHLPSATPVERGLLSALSLRYQSPSARAAVCQSWNAPYADAMAALHASFHLDLDVATLLADALLNLSPWHIWDLATGSPNPLARVPELEAVFASSLALPAAHSHPGLLHLYVHFVEMSPSPERGLPAAEVLRALVPDAGHLLHMPSHLDLLVGDYGRAIESNRAAIAADERYLERVGEDAFYANYRVHNLHSLVYAALLAGDEGTAMGAVGKLEAAVPEGLLRCEAPPMANFLEGYLSVRAHALVRFGRWEEVLGLLLPEDRELFCVCHATVWYARGIAYAVRGEVGGAERAREGFLEALGKIPAERTAYPNRWRDILGVGVEMLEGEIKYRKGEFEAAFSHLRRAVELDDGLVYNEPWGWMQPARHALGGLLLEQGRLEEATEVYAEDLGLLKKGKGVRRSNPKNVWALRGYAECLGRLGRTTELEIVEPMLKMALKGADVPIEVSCLCAKRKSGCGMGKRGESAEKGRSGVKVVEVEVGMAL